MLFVKPPVSSTCVSPLPTIVPTAVPLANTSCSPPPVSVAPNVVPPEDYVLNPRRLINSDKAVVVSTLSR